MEKAEEDRVVPDVNVSLFPQTSNTQGVRDHTPTSGRREQQMSFTRHVVEIPHTQSHEAAGLSQHNVANIDEQCMRNRIQLRSSVEMDPEHTEAESASKYYRSGSENGAGMGSFYYPFSNAVVPGSSGPSQGRHLGGSGFGEESMSFSRHGTQRDVPNTLNMSTEAAGWSQHNLDVARQTPNRPLNSNMNTMDPDSSEFESGRNHTSYFTSRVYSKFGKGTPGFNYGSVRDAALAGSSERQTSNARGGRGVAAPAKQSTADDSSDAPQRTENDSFKGMCGVCLDAVPDSVLIKCRLAFCQACLIMIKATTKRCPKCKKPFRKWDKIYV